MAQFIPVFVLFVFAITIQVLRKRELNLAQFWIISVIGVIAAWLSSLFILLLQNLELSIPYLITSEKGINNITFFLGDNNWIFGFLLLTLLVFSLFIDAGQLARERKLLTWSSQIIIGAVGLMVILSGSMITFLIISAIMDMLLFLLEHFNRSESRKSLLDLCLRFAGTFLIFLGEGLGSELNTLLVLLGLSFRLGVFHIFFATSFTLSSRQKPTPFFDIVLPLSTFSFIQQMGGVEGEFWGKGLLVTIILASVISKSVNLFRNLKTGHVTRLWVEVFSGLAIFAIISGNLSAVLPMAVVICTWGGVLSLEAIRMEKQKIAILVLMLAMIGLPYTPTAGLWILHEPIRVSALVPVVNLLIALMLLIGFERIITLSESTERQDGWVDFSVGVGPLFLLVMPWANMIIGEKMVTLLSNSWWSGFFLLGATILLLTKRNAKIRGSIIRMAEKITTVLQVARITENLLSFKWLRSFLTTVKGFLYDLINVFNRALEGDGGLLWTILFLILISSILVTYQLLI